MSILNGNSLDVLKTLDSSIAQTCITSPPYWGLRDYGMADQLGLEPTPEEYVKNLVDVFREVRRVLKDDGTLWINIGDSYASAGKNRSPIQCVSKSGLDGGRTTQKQSMVQKSKIVGELKPKDLVGIPWMLAFALRADGWWLRQDIIWHKPNPMPESVTDRCTKSHEYIFLLSKAEQYHFDHEAIKEPATHGSKDSSPGRGKPRPSKVRGEFDGKTGNMSFRASREMRNKRSVWTIPTKGISEAHFATFPENLVLPCILAGTRVNDLVLDPFFGAGTTGLVAQENQRKYLGIELNPEYIQIAKNRLGGTLFSNAGGL